MYNTMTVCVKSEDMTVVLIASISGRERVRTSTCHYRPLYACMVCMIIRILRDVYTSSLYNVFGSDSKHDDGMVLVNI